MRPVNEPKPRLVPVDGDCRQPEVCPLNEVRVGTSVRIHQLNGTPELMHRLREMGFCEQQRIKLLMKHTNVICQVCNVRLGISKQVAESIMVERLPGTQSKAA
jgi:Fe2+ transport system protein FeoA